MQANTCTNCGESLREGGAFCPECGSAVVPADASLDGRGAASAPSSMSARPEASCARCGNSLREGVAFCPACGSAVVTGGVAPAAPDRQTATPPTPAADDPGTSAAPSLPAGAAPDPSTARTVVGGPTPIPPGPQTAQLPPGYAVHPYATPPPPNPPAKRSGSSLALVLLGLVAFAAVTFAALGVAGVFSHGPATQTITSARRARPVAATSTVSTTPASKSNSSSSSSSSTSTSSTSASTAVVPGGTTSCGGDLFVGPNTSCPFARNVEAAYARSGGGNTPVTAYSPVTGLTYTIDCTGGAPHVCTGGTTHNASIYFTNSTISPTPQATPSSQPSATTTGEFASFAGTWGAHEESLVIDSNGTAHLRYADLKACPTCSFGNAPIGTVEFVLTSFTNGEGTGSVTASSDPRNWAVGAPVEVRLTAASPGQFLDVVIGGDQLINFCNSTSEGQCGA
jgi:RNA polymerase subunit RPABC4/transcription elongation factor Spt4